MNEKIKYHFVKSHLRRHWVAFTAIVCIGFLNSTVSFLLPVSIGEFFTLQFHTASSKSKLLAGCACAHP
ncbi:MAG: hypothetical protein C4308_08615 [Chitinophagaceae bacterium]